ncbi:MAG: sulfotransferase, partial [Alphaproteobacteria bacterium]
GWPPPVLILGTGRCGSTVLSNLLAIHPRVLSLSEFFVPLGAGAFVGRPVDGARMWRLYSRQNPAMHAVLKHGEVSGETLYPHAAPGARFGVRDMPPIMVVALPRLTDRHEELFDALAPFVRAQPSMPVADHYRALFEHLMDRLDRRVWVERSGGSLMIAAKLLRLFPEARVVHVFRDGHETALSMQRHTYFRVLLATLRLVERIGVDPFREFRSPETGPRLALVQRLLFPLLDARRLAAADLDAAEFGVFWSRLVLLGRELLGGLAPGRVLDLRFEELQAAPRETLRGLARFIDPALDDEGWLDRASAMVRPVPTRFEMLAPDRRRALVAACAPGRAALGYG